MERKAIVFDARRDGYGIDQIADNAMTVGELIGLLQDYEDDDLVVISHDSGYTYGSVRLLGEATEEEGGEWTKEYESEDC